MKIEWNEVTRLSQTVAIVIFVVVFFVGFFIGQKFENQKILGKEKVSVKFVCDENKIIDADFYKNFVHIKTDAIDAYIPQTISASGARYANSDESLVFWNKGDTAFITE